MPAPVLPERPVLVAPGAFKGTFRATQVAAAIGRGLERAGLMPPDLCPLADGGEGTTDVLLTALGGEVVGAGAAGSFALLEDGSTGLVEASDPATLAELVRAAGSTGASVILVAGWRAGVALPAVLERSSGASGAKLVPVEVPWVLEVLGFDERMLAARAVVTGEGTLDRHTLEGRLVGEIGRRTRQAGVPLHAVVGRDALDLFGRRMIDLQRVLEATTLQDLEVAGEQLGAELVNGRA